MRKSSFLVLLMLAAWLPAPVAAQPTVHTTSFVRVRASNNFGVAKQHEIFAPFAGAFGDSMVDTEVGTAAIATNTAAYVVTLTAASSVFEIQSDHTTSTGSLGNLTEGFIHFTTTEPYLYELSGQWAGAGPDAGDAYQQRTYLRQFVSPFSTVFLEDETRTGTVVALYVNQGDDTGGGTFNQSNPRLGVLPPGTYEFMYELEGSDRDNDGAAAHTATGRVRLALRRPVPPTDLHALTTGSSVALAWTFSADASTYVLEAGTAPGLANLFNGDIGGATALQAPVGAGTYFVRVRSRRGIALGPPSAEVSFTIGTACGGPPPTPIGHTAETAGLFVRLRWGSSPGATSYVLEAGTAPGLANLVNTALGSRSLFAAQAFPGTFYTRIRASNACGVSTVSNEVPFTLACVPPSAPANAAFTRPGAQIALSWTPSLGASGYVLQAGTAPGASNLFNGPVGASPLFAFPAAILPPGVYYLRVAALSACGLSAPSTELVVTLP
ncbi:MAG: hypothetical protein AB7H93_07365 [Vicinamibacterales bacterium]